MFKLLGSDEKEYGPVSADQIRQWIAQGRANAQTKLQAAGSTDWKPLAEFPDFADALRAAASPAGRRPSGAGAQPAAVAPKSSGLAITSLVLACLGLLTCGITSLVGLVLGIIALVKINKSGGQLGGKSIAVAGTSVSAALLLLMPIPAAMLLPALAKAKQKANHIRCISNLRQLNLGLMMYANDNNDRFPAGTNWCDALKPFVKDEKTYVCAAGKPGQRSHYAFNAKLAGRGMKDIQTPAQTVLIFEAEGGWNAAGGEELLPAKPRHAGAYAVGFADGHGEMVSAARLEKLRWEP
jgi:hypothetical protein